MEIWLEVYACFLGVPKVLFSVPLGQGILGSFGTELGGVLAASDVVFFGAFGGFALWRFGWRFMLVFRGSEGAFQRTSRAGILGSFGTELGGVLAASDVVFFGAFGGFALWSFGWRFMLVF